MAQKHCVRRRPDKRIVRGAKLRGRRQCAPWFTDRKEKQAPRRFRSRRPGKDGANNASQRDVNYIAESTIARGFRRTI
jgi:hypothetical protein